MSQADELLTSLSENGISLQLADQDTEPHIVIGADRFISVPKELQRIAVQYDHDVETVTFDCPRYWDDLDMSQLRIYINYMRKDRVTGCYAATDVTVDETDPSIMHFNWTISRNVSLVKGELKFLVCIKKTDEEGNEENHWNSELNAEMYVSEGLETSETVLEPYPDVIGQWEDEVQAVKDILLAARDSGELDGATFTPSVDDEGNLSWTNDRGRDNPATVNIHGHSPAILIREIDGGNELIITDYQGSKTVQIMDGYSPVILVREVEGGRELIITDSKQSQTVTVMDGVDGVNGYSPAVLVRDVEGGHELVITDYQGSKTLAVMDGVDGQDGADGYSPTVATEAVTGGTKVTITDKNGAKTFTVLNGVDGADGQDGSNGTNGTDGQDGADGVSPTIAVADINGGHRVTITDANGTQTFDVMDGTQEISQAVIDYMGTYMYIGDAEPTSGPVLWFDTTTSST